MSFDCNGDGIYVPPTFKLIDYSTHFLRFEKFKYYKLDPPKFFIRKRPTSEEKARKIIHEEIIYNITDVIIKMDHSELFTEEDKTTIAEIMDRNAQFLVRPQLLGYF